jgi:hypothetical protein
MAKFLFVLLIVLSLSACSFPGYAPKATPESAFFLPTIFPTATQSISAALTLTPTPTTLEASPFCKDPQNANLLASFKTAVTTSNGALLASLVSPTNGIEVRAFRNGRVITYDRDHAEFLFVTTWQAPWGNHPASGREVNGAFHEIIVPELLKVFTQTYTLECRKIQTGGATYKPEWPYQGTKFFSAYFAGTQANNNLDWYTWVIGIDTVNDKPYISTLIPFFWEP